MARLDYLAAKGAATLAQYDMKELAETSEVPTDHQPAACCGGGQPEYAGD